MNCDIVFFITVVLRNRKWHMTTLNGWLSAQHSARSVLPLSSAHWLQCMAEEGQRSTDQLRKLGVTHSLHLAINVTCTTDNSHGLSANVNYC